jgi:glucose dehydrogenase
MQLQNLFDPKKSVLKFTASLAYETTFALRKMLLVLTQQNNLINLDTKTAEILWKYLILSIQN